MDLDRRQIMAAAICATASTGALAATQQNGKSGNMTDTKTYAAVAMQLTARSTEKTPNKAVARKQMLNMIGEMENKIRSAAIFIQQYAVNPVKLAVLP